MTGEAHDEVVRQALAEEKDPAFLTGGRAKVAMFCVACLLVGGPFCFFIPVFHGWRDVVAWCVGLAMVLSGPFMAAFIPRAIQEQYRQALVQSEELRRRAVADAREQREFVRELQAGREGASDGAPR